MISRSRAFLAAGLLALTSHASLAAQPCIHTEEIEAFSLRHLQSRLMVAALSCNQRDAYNTFVTRFQDKLGEGGVRLTAYFARSGGGKAGLNKYVTDVANAAGLGRASDPNGFCTQTWQVFWELSQAPEALLAVADANIFMAVNVPKVCPNDRNEVAVTKTAAPLNTAAAVR
jgi:hypothetical protein